MPQIEVPTSQRHGSAPAYRNHSLNLEIAELPPPQPAASEGQQVAKVHDFLSLCGRASNSSGVTITAHAEGNNRSYLPSQHPPYAVVNGSVEYPSSLPANYRSQFISSHSQQGITINKNWQTQQQPQPQQLVPLDVNIKHAKEPSEEEDDDDDESLDHGNKESRNLKCETVQRVDAKIIDTKNLTPRSKHSATEQRRRSKINDRFQTLRKLLPNADQKRDKASFLQEVIEYIQMLHERIRKYEGAEHDGNHEEKVKPATITKSPLAHNEVNAFYVPMASVEPMDSNGYVRSRMNSSCLLGEADSNRSTELNMGIQSLSKLPVCPASYDNKALVTRTPSIVSSHHPVIKEQGSTPAISMATQPIFGDGLHQDSSRVKSSPYSTVEAPVLAQSQLVRHTMTAQASSYGLNEDSEKLRNSECSLYTPNRSNMQEEEQGQDKHDRSWLSQGLDKHQVDVGSSSRGSRKDDGGKVEDSARPHDGHGQEHKDEARGNEQPPILGGVINISSVYSQGLVDTLANALQSSGVDMSQATISVKIDLGNLGSSLMNSTRRDPSLSSPLHNLAVSSQESEQSRKRAKLEFDL